MAESDPRGVAFRELDDLLEKKQYRAAIKKADESAPASLLSTVRMASSWVSA